MSLLDALFRGGQLRTLDHALAQSLRGLDPATPEPVLAGAALASLAVARGHAGFDPARVELLLDSPLPAAWPSPEAWAQAFGSSRWIATPAVAAEAESARAADGGSDPACPLVYEHGLLYLRRYREYEQRLADGLLRLARAPGETDDVAALAPLFAALFPGAGGDDLQAHAAALALHRTLLLVTGGPGTGKTTTIVRLLLLLLARAGLRGEPAPRIALAAPTGRAAERMHDSVQQGLAGLRTLPGVDSSLGNALPAEARTLHRLLGLFPGSARPRFDARTPLPYEVVVVDEASMVDLPLMCRLVEAVATGARLILLGDRDQLPSVEAGDVLAAIGSAMGEDAALPPELQPLLGPGPARGTPGPDPARRPGPLAGHRVHLRRGYRQSQALDLAPLAEAVRTGDADTALRLLQAGSLSGVHFHADAGDPLQAPGREALLAPWRALQDCDDPQSALLLAGQVRLLTALREGPQGANPLNARIEALLGGAQRDRYFHGRLLMVTENSPRHGLFNGDFGVCWRDRDRASTRAWFAADGRGSGLRQFSPTALPAHDSAFAMSVHKAQGSEFDEVWLLLPQQDARVLSRELLYTAMTRARSGLHVCAGESVLRAALQRHEQRISGLAQRLNTQVSTTST